jgi:hypothetical protein
VLELVDDLADLVVWHAGVHGRGDDVRDQVSLERRRAGPPQVVAAPEDRVM